MIKSRNIDASDIHKLVQIPLFVGDVTATSLTAVARYLMPTDATLIGAQINVMSTGNADNTLHVEVQRISDGYTPINTGVDADFGGGNTLRFVASGATSSPAPDSNIGNLAKLNAGDLITVYAAVSGTTPAANSTTVTLEFQ